MPIPVPVDHPWPALARAAAQWPDAEALIFPHQNARLAFAQWYDKSARLAGGLAGLGIKAGDRIALLAENRVEWPVVQMAAAALGGVFAPLNTHYRRDDLAYALKQSRAGALIVSRAFRGNPYLDTVEGLRADLPELQHVVCLDGGGTRDYAVLSGGSPIPPQAEPDPEAPGALLYTSGTTGFPKAALLSHRAMMMNARGTAERLGVRAGDRWTSIIPLFHCAGCIMNMLGCLQMGAAYVGVPSFDAQTMFSVIAAECCTVLSGVPTSYLAMLDHRARGAGDLSSLRTGTCGGSDCNSDILKRCAAEFPMPGLVQVYGQTEGATLLACPAADDPRRFDTAGLAVPGFGLRIADPATGEGLAAGAIGEIQGRGPMVMLGYFNDPRATAETITPAGWLRTGDLGMLTQDGHLVVTGGRLRDMIIRGAENIYPAEIENVLQQHPALAAVAVFGVPDAYYGEAVAAAVILKVPVPAAELQSFCMERIAKFKAPSAFYRIERLPLTASGKVRKLELRQWAAEGRMESLP